MTGLVKPISPAHVALVERAAYYGKSTIADATKAAYEREFLHFKVCAEPLAPGVACGLRPDHDVTHEAEVDVLRRMANNYLGAFEQVDCELRASRQETPQHTHCPVCDRPIYNGKHPDLPCVPGRQIGDVWIPAKPDVRVLSVHGNDKVTGRDYRAAY